MLWQHCAEVMFVVSVGFAWSTWFCRNKLLRHLFHVLLKISSLQNFVLYFYFVLDNIFLTTFILILELNARVFLLCNIGRVDLFSPPMKGELTNLSANVSFVCKHLRTRNMTIVFLSFWEHLAHIDVHAHTCKHTHTLTHTTYTEHFLRLWPAARRCVSCASRGETRLTAERKGSKRIQWSS